MLRLGPIQLQTNLLLAPIAGYCDLAFRTICREWGGVGLACTDLLSPQGLLRGTATSLDLARTNAFDKPVGMQLYGSDPEIMAEGARWAVEHGATVIDINMGCPVDKVTKKDGGSKLLTDLSRAVRVTERVVRELEKIPLDAGEWSKRLGPAQIHLGPASPQAPHASHPPPLASRLSPSASPVPLTCKIRLCWNTSDYESGAACSPHLARMLADVGVVAVTVHGRTTEDKFSGSVRLDGIARVVEAVNGRIPIIGNGDVRAPEDAERMLRHTGCQGIMIGRGALSTPWLFRDTWAHLCAIGLATPPPGMGGTGVRPVRPPEPTESEKLATIRRFFNLMREYRDDRYAVFQINRRVSWFAKTLQRDAGNGKLESIKPFKEAVRNATTADEVFDALDRFEAGGLRGGFETAHTAADVSG
ncbi:tRNA-dihydrouridine synthase B [Phycisphaerales bacterium]|nr:tRNA-dihydrouridine synthase B [Phycisphaerales bacterium]